MKPNQQSELDAFTDFCLRRKLAEMGHLDQQINMGNYYREGEIVKYNPRVAFCWYMRAAKQGDWCGQLLVADCYFEGDGVKQDYKEAVKWYESGVAQFDNEHSDRVDEEEVEDLSIDIAVNRITQCYREGLGVKKDLEKAAEWYDKAGWHRSTELIRKYGDDADEHDPDMPF